MKILIPICLLIIASCQNDSGFRELTCIEAEYYNSDEIRHSTEVKVIFRDDLNRYDFSRIDLAKNDTFNFKVEKNNTDYQFLYKSFKINDKNINIVRIDNELVASVDGRTYYYLLENGRPIFIKSRDWSTYQTFTTNKSDTILLNELRNDTTCFFRCIPKTPPKPTYKTQLP